MPLACVCVHVFVFTLYITLIATPVHSLWLQPYQWTMAVCQERRRTLSPSLCTVYCFSSKSSTLLLPLLLYTTIDNKKYIYNIYSTYYNILCTSYVHVHML